jgi:hypothetical protein
MSAIDVVDGAPLGRQIGRIGWALMTRPSTFKERGRYKTEGDEYMRANVRDRSLPDRRL